MVQNIALCGYTIPSPIQAYAIPAVVTGRDVIGVAQTGKSQTSTVNYLLILF